MSMNTQAMQNTLQGERTHISISFPASGDPELDCMAGLVAVLEQVETLNSPDLYGQAAARRALCWFFMRTAHIHGLPTEKAFPVPAPQFPSSFPNAWLGTTGGNL